MRVSLDSVKPGFIQQGPGTLYLAEEALRREFELKLQFLSKEGLPAMVKAMAELGMTPGQVFCSLGLADPAYPQESTWDTAPLDKPLTEKDVDSDGWVRGVIRLELSELISNDLEGVLDIMSERLTGSGLLSDIAYEVVGHDGDTLFVRVSGDARLIEWATDE